MGMDGPGGASRVQNRLVWPVLAVQGVRGMRARMAIGRATALPLETPRQEAPNPEWPR